MAVAAATASGAEISRPATPVDALLCDGQRAALTAPTVTAAAAAAATASGAEISRPATLVDTLLCDGRGTR